MNGLVVNLHLRPQTAHGTLEDVVILGQKSHQEMRGCLSHH